MCGPARVRAGVPRTGATDPPRGDSIAVGLNLTLPFTAERNTIVGHQYQHVEHRVSTRERVASINSTRSISDEYALLSDESLFQ